MRKLSPVTVKMALSRPVCVTFCHSDYLPGAVACSCNPDTWRQVLLDGLREGVLLVTGSCRSGVRTKATINMALF